MVLFSFFTFSLFSHLDFNSNLSIQIIMFRDSPWVYAHLLPGVYKIYIL